ncbi:hypothetical protein E0Z10_g191 [Xylaria hypoxylon]|uniref:Flavin-nucleotide-binding protein n=1 Tax=Xylaria hypoxylon TaxID=37992 RepID=A0A4Z0YWZ1_9PEZI|nr:hypothetical protein E0Z10_g191 [Xylaria hypoxylon]
MPSEALQYPTKPYSKVNRYDGRATYALKTIHELVNTCPILQVSFTAPDSPFPMMLPMLGQMGSFARPSSDTGDVLELYLHGYVSSRFINLSRKSSGGGDVSGAETEPSGLPITIGASHIDGLVLALTPNSHSYNYRSAVLFGHAEIVTDVEEKLWAMELITNSVVRDRYCHTRLPPNNAEMQSTSILRVKIASGSAKIRSGMPKDDKSDVEDSALLDRVWTGVVPVHYTLGAPIPGPYNRLQALPAYLDEYVSESNQDAKDIAVEAATKVAEPKPKLED